MQQENLFISGTIFALFCLGIYLSFIWKSFKVSEETENRFVFGIRSTFLWPFAFFTSVISLAAIFSTLTFSPTTILTCKHSCPEISVGQLYPNCQLTVVSWLGTEKSKTSIENLQAALLDAKLDNDDKSNLFDRYRVTLATEKESIPFVKNYIYTSDSEYQNLLNIISQVNSFVGEPLQDSLTVEQSEKELGFVCFALSIFFGLITFLLVKIPPYITCFFDRELDRVTIERRNLFGSKSSDYNISDITAVKLESTSDSDGAYFRLTLLLTSGQKVPLTYTFTSDCREKQHIANQLQKFLGLGKSKS